MGRFYKQENLNKNKKLWRTILDKVFSLIEATELLFSTHSPKWLQFDNFSFNPFFFSFSRGLILVDASSIDKIL